MLSTSLIGEDRPGTVDAINAKLLNLIQEDDQASMADLAQRVKLSPAGVHRRLKKLQDQGVIKKRVALLDRSKVGIDLLCFLTVSFKENMNPGNRSKLERAMHDLPEVLECYTLTGGIDAILKVAVRDHNALKQFLQRLAESQDLIGRVQTSIALEEIKATTRLPVVPEEEMAHD
jgi:DNA-binding Lrp family transcriptional regulator